MKLRTLMLSLVALFVRLAKRFARPGAGPKIAAV
jgi:hypothetical protein